MNEPAWVHLSRVKLDSLRKQEVLCFDHNQKFALQQEIASIEQQLAAWSPPPPPSPPPPHIRLPHGAPQLFGRDDDLEWLERAWNAPAAHVATIVAWGGVGKTSLVSEWRNRLVAEGRAPEWLFEWSFYSQGVRDRGAVSADSFLREALRFFGDPGLADSPASPWEKGARLAALVGERRALLILDGLEPLQHPGDISGSPGKLKEGSIEALLSGLAVRNAGLCVVTTRVAVAELERFDHTLAPRLDLGQLSETAGANFLASLLSPRNRIAVTSTHEQRVEISRAVDGHALTLQLLGIYIQRALGDIDQWRTIDFSRASAEQGGHAFRVMEAYVRWLSGAGPRGQQQLAVLRLLGLFDRPADPGCIAALRQPPAIEGVTEPVIDLDHEGWRALLSSLEELRLVTLHEYQAQPVSGYDEAAAQRAGAEAPPSGPPQPHPPLAVSPGALELDAHPLVREFFARDLRTSSPAGWREGHTRLYEHLCASVPYWPEGVDGLQPLYQAVVHGCAAGRTTDARASVYRARIGRGNRFYSSRQLGAISADLAAIACFFEHPWDRPSTALCEADKSWVLNSAAFRLRALGRLHDALAPMRAGLEMRVRQESWKNAAIAAGNLSELELSLGHTTAALELAAQAVEHADRSEDDFQRIVKRTTLADARHQTGDTTGANELFEQAESMQARHQPTYSCLYSLPGHRYCDLLLHPAERAAWRTALGHPAQDDGSVTRCREVVARATRTLAWIRPYGWLLDVAMDHLTLGRAALCAAVLHDGTAADEPDLSLAAARTHLEAAVDGLRSASALYDLPGALLARAWLRHRDSPDLARADLDEAWTLAERGPMPLFQADILLTRARLFRARDDLARARELIDRHGYGRRRDELADAEHLLGLASPRA